MANPVAVLVADVHYNITTLEVADKAMRIAIDKANQLSVPLIVCGDLHDTKAHLRGECVNAMIETFKQCLHTPFVVRGNHCSLNEKSKETSLTFLDSLAVLINDVYLLEFHNYKVQVIAYYHDSNELRKYLKIIPPKSTLIMHQGVAGTNVGHYIQDKSAITPQDVAGFRVISGHYHTRQTIELPDGGTWDYVGNPYTLNFAEANDPPKGFQVLYDDGSLEFIPTNLRKHVVIENHVSELVAIPYVHKPGDLLWFKVHGTREELNIVTKNLISNNYGIEEGFKLDLIPDETKATLSEENVEKHTQPELLDGLIGSLTNVSDEQKNRLHSIWKDLCES